MKINKRYIPLFVSGFASALLVLFVLARPAVYGADPPKRTAPQPPPRTFQHPPPPAKAPHPPRPTVPHGPSENAEPFMQKLQAYNQRIKENPKDIEALIFVANANFDIQRYEKAQALYLRVLKIEPNNLHVRTDLAAVYRNLGDSNKAVEELKVVLSLNPNHEVALYNMGIILLNDTEDFNGAADAWERLVKINPKDPLADALRAKVKSIRSGELKPSPAAKPK